MIWVTSGQILTMISWGFYYVGGEPNLFSTDYFLFISPWTMLTPNVRGPNKFGSTNIVVNIMVADALVRQGAWASATMI